MSSERLLLVENRAPLCTSVITPRHTNQYTCIVDHVLSPGNKVDILCLQEARTTLRRLPPFFDLYLDCSVHGIYGNCG